MVPVATLIHPRPGRPRLSRVWPWLVGVAALHGVVQLVAHLEREHTCHAPAELVTSSVRTRLYRDVLVSNVPSPCTVAVVGLRLSGDDIDPWGHALQVRCVDVEGHGEAITVVSAGRDGLFGTADDRGTGEGWCQDNRRAIHGCD